MNTANQMKERQMLKMKKLVSFFSALVFIALPVPGISSASPMKLELPINPKLPAVVISVGDVETLVRNKIKEGINNLQYSETKTTKLKMKTSKKIKRLIRQPVYIYRNVREYLYGKIRLCSIRCNARYGRIRCIHWSRRKRRECRARVAAKKDDCKRRCRERHYRVERKRVKPFYKHIWRTITEPIRILAPTTITYGYKTMFHHASLAMKQNTFTLTVKLRVQGFARISQRLIAKFNSKIIKRRDVTVTLTGKFQIRKGPKLHLRVENVNIQWHKLSSQGTLGRLLHLLGLPLKAVMKPFLSKTGIKKLLHSRLEKYVKDKLNKTIEEKMSRLNLRNKINTLMEKKNLHKIKASKLGSKEVYAVLVIKELSSTSLCAMIQNQTNVLKLQLGTKATLVAALNRQVLLSYQKKWNQWVFKVSPTALCRPDSNVLEIGLSEIRDLLKKSPFSKLINGKRRQRSVAVPPQRSRSSRHQRKK